jgi:hypothetical protein
MVDDIAEQSTATGRFHNHHVTRPAFRAEGARREIYFAAGIAALQAKLTYFGAIPIMLGFGGWCWNNAAIATHLSSPRMINSGSNAVN